MSRDLDYFAIAKAIVARQVAVLRQGAEASAEELSRAGQEEIARQQEPDLCRVCHTPLTEDGFCPVHDRKYLRDCEEREPYRPEPWQGDVA